MDYNEALFKRRNELLDEIVEKTNKRNSNEQEIKKLISEIRFLCDELEYTIDPLEKVHKMENTNIYLLIGQYINKPKDNQVLYIGPDKNKAYKFDFSDYFFDMREIQVWKNGRMIDIHGKFIN